MYGNICDLQVKCSQQNLTIQILGETLMNFKT